MSMMHKSEMRDDWIRRSVLANPIILLTPKDGGSNRNIRTCPVRLSFPEVFKPKARRFANQPQTQEKFSVVLLFPPQQAGVDFSPMSQEVYRVLNEKFAKDYNPHTRQYQGVYTPFRDQGEKANKLEGYTPGAMFVTCTSRYKPAVVDHRLNPIVDESAVYPGVWALATINAYDFGVTPPQLKKGVSFGLQSLMIIAGDLKLGGGGSNPAEDYAGVNIEASTNIAEGFGMPFGQPTMPVQQHPAGQSGFGPGPDLSMFGIQR